MYNKHSVGNFGPFVSIADRAEALPEHAKRVSWPEPCLIGGGTKGPENCRECVYTWRGSFGPLTTVKIESRFLLTLQLMRQPPTQKSFLQFVKMKWNQRINITFTSNGPVKDNGAEGEDDPDHKAPDIKNGSTDQDDDAHKFHGIAKFKTGLGIVGDGDKSHV